MSLLSGLTPPSKERICFVAKTAAGLSAEDQKILLEAIANPQWSITGLVEALRSRGVNLSRGTLERHRKGKCGC